MRKLILIFSICTFSWLGLGGCGGDDCPTCPPVSEEPDYQLVYSYVGQYPDTYVLTYSTKSGEVVDSAHYLGNPFDNVVFSHDGEYACYTSNYDLELGASETWVTRWATGDTVAYRSGIGSLLAYLTEDDKYLLLTGGNIVAILNFPDLTPVYFDSLSSWGGALHPTNRLAYISLDRARDSIFVLDYSEVPVGVTSYQLIDSHGNVRHSLGPIVCTDQYLIILYSGYLGLFDPLTLGLLKDRTFEPPMAYRGVLHPDGRRLFLPYYVTIGLFPVSGGVDLYNIEANTLQPWIGDGEIDLGTGEPFVPNQIEFAPDGKSMFVLSGGNGFWLGPILQINIATKEVMQRFDNSDGFSRLISLNPKNMAIN